MQYVQLLRELGNIQAAFQECERAVDEFKGFYKLWLIKA
jgi:hypothetical protein